MPVLKNISTLYTCPDTGDQSDVGEIRNAALVWNEGLIVWAGREVDLPKEYRGYLTLNARGRMVIPGLIDCHTHLAFGGWRADEFSMRSLGQSYTEIARSGGGILSSVKSTRQTDPRQLFKKCQSIVAQIIKLGITTIEAKTGYGLDLDTELNVLGVYRQLNEAGPLEIIPTYLGAHSIPPEFSHDRRLYIRSIVNTVIPMVNIDGSAKFIDIFVEDSAFTSDEARRIFAVGTEYDLRPKLHADQLSNCGGAELAAEVRAISADHLEHVSDRGIELMHESGVIAVSLPLATFYLKQNPVPARKFINKGVPLAVATDFNPGSAPSWHLPLAMTMACTLQSMSPAEVLKGATVIAARAIEAEDSRGSLMTGKQADFAIIDAPDVNHWMYHFLPNACVATYKKGIAIHDVTAKEPLYPWT
jgi:imidazolonepropionase